MLGVWLRSKIAKGNALALDLAEHFVNHEARRNARRVNPDQ